ncbi:hypothetical protein ACPW96_15705 [Micromonospora sp. DT81.3]|uniref:hypothetical protein n=1 Tax=Micromonospora sp. DT81.3 TaxID=3416523 RepID=UPI003CE6B091
MSVLALCVGVVLAACACSGVMSGNPGIVAPGAPDPDWPDAAPAPGEGDPSEGLAEPDTDIPLLESSSLSDALSTASLETRFDPAVITQFETTRFTATIVFGVPIDSGATEILIAWSNEATLMGEDPESFEVSPTSPSRQWVDNAFAHPSGGYALSWTWDVTPLLAGDRTLNLRIRPTVVIDGEVVEEYADINEPVVLAVEVHPVQRDLDEVAAAAQSLELDLPEKMTVGEEHVVTITVPLEGHADTIGADVELSREQGSASASIEMAGQVENDATAGAESRAAIERTWTVTPTESGRLDLVLMTSVRGEAAGQELRREVHITAATTVVAAPPTFWELLQGPVVYITPFVALAATIVGVWQTRRRRKPTASKDTTEQHA